MRCHLPENVIGEVRSIRPGDESALHKAELAGVENAVLSRRRSRGAGRIVARKLCAQLGFEVEAIPQGPTGGPLWPDGLTGSIAHDESFACAVVARKSAFGGLGVDIESANPLSDGEFALISTPCERLSFRLGSVDTKALFTIKEAVFKATNPLDNIFLDFPDIVVECLGQSAKTSYGRTVSWRVIVQPRVIAVAWW